MSARQNHTSRSLTTRLLFFTVLFVLLAEIVVMIPSLANRRLDWFNDRIETAYLVSVALEGPRGRMDGKPTRATVEEISSCDQNLWPICAN